MWVPSEILEQGRGASRTSGLLGLCCGTTRIGRGGNCANASLRQNQPIFLTASSHFGPQGAQALLASGPPGLDLVAIGQPELGL